MARYCLLALLGCSLALPHASRAAPGDRDPTFQPVLDGLVHAIAVQPDQRIVIGGGFTNVNNIRRPYLARLLPDGTLDESFDAGAIPTMPVDSLMVDSLGRIVFSFGNRVVRVTVDGRREPTNNIPFLPWHDALFYIQDAQYNFPGKITVLTPSSGLILVGGQFTRYEATNGTRTARAYVARLLPDGRLDFTFAPQINPLTAPEREVRSLLYQPDGKIVVAGWVYAQPAIGSVPNGIFRLTSSGQIDQTFTNGFTNAWRVVTVGATLQADGKIVTMGIQDTYEPPFRPTFLMRLNPDRSTDPTFNLSYPDVTFNLLAQQRNGKVLAFSGSWNSNSLSRYLPDGNRDPTFHLESSTNSLQLRAVAFQSDGRILIGGQLGSNFLARLIGSADARFEAITPQANQKTRLVLRGETYQPYQMQSSSNLVHWTAGATATSSNGIIEFEHTNSTPRRFFRALQLP